MFICVLLLLQLQEDRIRAIQEKLELCEQKLAQYAKLPDMEQELKQRMEALTQVRAQVRLQSIIIPTPLLIVAFLVTPVDLMNINITS